MSRKTVTIGLTGVLLLVGLIVSLIEAWSDAYLWISLYVIVVAMIPFYVRFERKAWNSREMVMIATLAALAAASRIPFASLPSVTPTSFVIIASALVLGGEAGFLIGATAALVSNFVLGQGPWTPWQMFSWGMMGFTAGWLSHSLLKSTFSRIVFCLAWGFVFGWLMNISFLITYVAEWSGSALLTAGLASFYFDLAHALSNAVLFLLFGNAWIRILQRFQQKYLNHIEK